MVSARPYMLTMKVLLNDAVLPAALEHLSREDHWVLKVGNSFLKPMEVFWMEVQLWEADDDERAALVRAGFLFI
jgi:hypothetical protein